MLMIRSRMIAAMLLSAIAGTPASAAPVPTACTAATGLEAYRGKVVYLDFWASWCVPCRLSFPFMNRLDQDLRERGLVVLALNLDARRADAERFLAGHPAQFVLGFGNNEACARGMGVAAMPSSYLIDRHGNVRAVHAGFRPGQAANVRAEVERLLSESGAS